MRAMLKREALLQRCADEIVEQLSIHGGIKWGQLSLGDEPLEIRLQSIGDLLFCGAQALRFVGRLRLNLIVGHKAHVLAGTLKGRLDNRAWHLPQW